MKKKAVVILYSPRGILEFLWYYCTYGKDYEWTAVCALYGDTMEYRLHTCEKLGIFSNILRDERDFMGMSMSEKTKLFLKMGLYFILGQRKRFCKSIIKEAIGDLDYQLVVISCDFGILPGAFLAESKKKKVVILEDGSADYVERHKWPSFQNINSVNDVAGFLLAKMGYANTAFCYAMKDTKFCEKFAVYPEKLKYRDYKTIEKLNDMSYPDFDKEKFEMLREKILNDTTAEYVGDVALFTTAFGINDPYDYVVPAVENYINQNYAGKTLILKKHPRDNCNYKFSNNIKVHEIDKNLPMEVLGGSLKVKRYIYMAISSSMLSQQMNIDNIDVLYFSELEKKYRNVCNYKESFLRGLHICKIKDENVKVI